MLKKKIILYYKIVKSKMYPFFYAANCIGLYLHISIVKTLRQSGDNLEPLDSQETIWNLEAVRRQSGTLRQSGDKMEP